MDQAANYWEEVKAASAKLKNAVPTKYKELWIPGFTIEHSATDFKLADSLVGDKHLVKAADIGSCSVYCPKPHDAGLKVDSIENALIIKKGFFFGIIITLPQ